MSSWGRGILDQKRQSCLRLHGRVRTTLGLEPERPGSATCPVRASVSAPVKWGGTCSVGTSHMAVGWKALGWRAGTVPPSWVTRDSQRSCGLPRGISFFIFAMRIAIARPIKPGNKGNPVRWKCQEASGRAVSRCPETGDQFEKSDLPHCAGKSLAFSGSQSHVSALIPLHRVSFADAQPLSAPPTPDL